MTRHEVVTAYGDIPQAEAISLVDDLARLRSIPVTITPAVGSCAPWDTEAVLVISNYGTDRLAFRVFAEGLRIMFRQEAVALATTEANFDILEGKS